MNTRQITPEGIEPGPDGTAAIRQLNDAFRQTFVGGRVVMTAGVAALPESTRAAVPTAVRAFNTFSADNDPHGEHDFGALTVAGHRLFWKIDVYDLLLRFGSPDPANRAATVRVLTVMLAEEY